MVVIFQPNLETALALDMEVNEHHGIGLHEHYGDATRKGKVDNGQMLSLTMVGVVRGVFSEIESGFDFI